MALVDSYELKVQLEALIQSQNDQIESMQSDYNESLDTIWMLLAAALVFFMHAGFSLLEAGSVRFKNTQNILAKNLVVVTVGFLCWWAFGYAWAFGGPEAVDPNRFIGHQYFFHGGFWNEKSLFRFWFFQGAFCATGATIVSGAMAERTNLVGFALYTFFMTSWIYPVVVYWAWSGEGLLNFTHKDGASVSAVGSGFIDFAGSGVVHLVGGVGALLGAVVVGPRKGRFNPSLEPEFDAHSIPFCVLGTFCLWFGWYGFNPGSTGSMHDEVTAHLAGMVAVNTTIAACCGGITVFLLRWLVLEPRLMDVGGFCNGILAGLVSITGGCASVKPWEALFIGLWGGIFYQFGSMLLKFAKIDDVVDAIPVHGICGFWGVIAMGFFGKPLDGLGGDGAFYGGHQIGVQAFGAMIIFAWVAFWSMLILIPLRFFGLLRLADAIQDTGADAHEHSPSKAYTAPTGANSGVGSG
eukprot:CAMPEP_0206466730 /NCGR_PEP_ID=MMETSP0324_2-20121206/28628_1 /ASSEMBLY_ACC=CAM_ASM_000836 /TAXON_ID=2866 /ORGANISM="Crypthecodinium cohnii, Strain Seligo" /LENGTH=465 /DNA_ID=CAMNT_0053939893 /DNA_START=36 /DNA_END=1433 /DNA_ORIENTATION=-